jgi:hypothetical protein
MGTWTAIINSDIVVAEKIKNRPIALEKVGCKCAISRRYDLDSGFVIDYGLDFFLGDQDVWESAYRKIPQDFRIGFGAWDNWMIGHFCNEFGRKCADITSQRCIFHPAHEDRLSPNWNGPGLDHKYIKRHYWPTTVIR